jgi:multidrug resistance efflux pump
VAIVQSSESEQKDEKDKKQKVSADSQRLKLVQRLLASGDNLPAFLQDLLNTQAMMVAGTEAAAFLLDQSQQGQKLLPVVHMRPDQASDDVRKAAVNAFVQLVTPCIEQNREGAFEVGAADDAGEAQFCLATVLRQDGQPVGVTAVITRCRGNDRAKQRLASMELVAGYFEIFAMRRTVEQSKQLALSHQGVLQLVGSIATTDGFESACKNVCNELATRTGAARVAVGWVKREQVKVIALSHTEKFDKRQELLTQTKAVMEECFDQQQIVHYDPAGGGTDTVNREATAYSRQNANCVVVSIPLRRMEEIVGVLMLEYAADRKPDQNSNSMVAITGDVLTPQLYDRYQNDRNIFIKIGGSIEHLAKETIGPKHTLAKVIAVAALIAVLILVFYKPMYRVSAPFQFAAQDRRTLTSPSDGYIGEIGEIGEIDGQVVRPGVRVKQGDILVKLDTTELRLQLAEAQTKANGLQKEADQKLHQEGKTAEAMIALEQRKEALAQADLMQWKIDHSIIRAPIDGEILRGDLRDRRGSAIKEGDSLFEIGSLKDIEVEATVAERDIQFIRKDQLGQFATSSDPGESVAFKVDRIVPMGEPKDNANVFKVYGKIDVPQRAEWKPGMAGEVRIETEHARVIWIWTHRLMDWLRLKLWW